MQNWVNTEAASPSHGSYVCYLRGPRRAAAPDGGGDRRGRNASRTQPVPCDSAHNTPLLSRITPPCSVVLMQPACPRYGTHETPIKSTIL
eukprot:1186376-Prorocentrum_minimum.AAC.5